MSTYSILNAGRIVAGPDSIEQIADIVKVYGASRVLIISDKGVARAGLIDRPKALLEAAGIAVSILDDTPPEPEVEQANAIVTAAKNSGCDMVVGIGGGSAMDVAKLVRKGQAQESQTLAEAVRLFGEHRVLADGHRTVIFR